MIDSDLGNNGVETAPAESRADWPSPGKKLRLIREDLGLSYSRVAEALHMTAHYVKALENDEFEKLPGKTFIKGYFRSYAKFLGTDVEEVIQCYEQYVAALEESETSEANVIRARKAYDQNIRWLICAAIIIVIVIAVSWWLSGDNESSTASSDKPDRNPGIAQSTGSGVAKAVAGIAGQGASPLRADQRVMSEMLTVQTVMNESSTGTIAEVIDDSAQAQASTREVPTLIDPETDTTDSQDLVSTPMAIEDDQDVLAAAADSVELASPVIQSVEEMRDIDNGLPEYTVTRLDDHRLVELDLAGSDLVILHSEGDSWVEVDDGDSTRLFHDMPRPGDDLNIHGTAPFSILLGDANVVDITFNSRPVSIPPIRQNNSARVILEPETR
jgi:cytoskeleton protein RodZ